jgi:hypothetical protein
MVAPAEYDISARLLGVQRGDAQRRCADFVDYAPVVCGLVLHPITLRSYTRLIVFESAFTTEAAVTVEEIINFVWIHHPAFSQFAREEKAAVSRHVYRALHPRFPHLNQFFRLVALHPRYRWVHRFTSPTAGERLAASAAEIRRLLAEALRDFPRSAGNDTPSPVPLPAHMLNTLRRGLDLTFSEIEQMPLRRLLQHLRELIHHADPSSVALISLDEEEIWIEHMTPAAADPHST